MFFTYIWRELRRRHRQALLTALGLAVGVGLVVAVTAYAGGVSAAQNQVLESLYGVGTDISVTETAQLEDGSRAQIRMQPPSQEQQGEAFAQDRLMGSPGQQTMAANTVTQITGLDGVSAAAGALVLNVMHVEGEYAQAFAQGGQQQSQSGEMPEPSASQAPMEFSSFSLTGIDTTSTERRPTRVQRACLRALAGRNGRQGEGRPGRPGLRRAGRDRARRHHHRQREEVRGRRYHHLDRRRLILRRLHSSALGAEAQRQRRQGQPDLRARRERRPDPRREECRSDGATRRYRHDLGRPRRAGERLA